MKHAPLLVLTLLIAAAGSDGCGKARPDRRAVEHDVREASRALFGMAGRYFNDESPPPGEIDTLSALLARIGAVPDNLQPRTDSPTDAPADSAGGFAGLRSTISAFAAARSGAPQFDTVRRAFRDVLYEFHNSYRGFLRGTALRGGGDKLLLFSASVTCDCTRELSDSYTREIILAKQSLEYFPGLLLMDCSAEPGLMAEYGIETIPAVLILDGGNTVVARFQGTAYIFPQLVEFLTSRGNLEMTDR